MDFKTLLVVSAMGAFAGDQFFFHLGRLKGKDLFRPYPSWRQKIDKAVVLLDRRREVVTLSYRFIYGMRAVIPFLLGSGHCSVPRFALLSFISAIAWAVVIATGAFFLGEAFQTILDRNRSFQKGIFVVAVLFAMAVMALRWVIRRNGPRR
jgi:membrane protein DedA with SNARE-associated domain